MANDWSVRIRTLAGLTLASMLGACGGGGGGGAPVSFSFASSTVTLAEDAATNDVVIVLHCTFPSLTEDVTVEVTDAGTGTATSGADYAAFATQTITFLTGAVDGATQTVTLDPLDDSSVEAGNESVRLRLQNPSLGEGLASPTQYTATLTDIHAAEVAFATPSETVPNEAGGAQAVALELECGTGVSLGVAVSVRVSDLRTGSAAPVTDYASFAAQTVTFPVGSADGAIQTVNLTVLNDTTLESNETVRLGLSAPSITCTLGPTTVHELTIQDDDLALNAFLFPTEGPAGTGNTLAYDELIPLGTQAVGAGPNAGTLMRITNGGGTPMELGAPSLLASSTNPNDFAIDIESSSWAAAGDASAFPAVDAATPLVALEPDGGPGVALRIEPAALARLAGLEHVVLHDFALPDLGPVTLALRRRELPIRPDATLAIDGVEVEGGPRTLLGDLQRWAGSVLGMEGSRVFLSLDSRSAQGFVELPLAQDRFVHFLADGAGRVRLVRDSEAQALGFGPPQEVCAGERFAPGSAMTPLGMPGEDEPSSAALTIAECSLAIETDWQLYQKFGSSPLLTSYVTELIAAVSEQYFTDVQAELSIQYLGIHTTSNDGWSAQDSGGDTADVLDEFLSAWDNPNDRPPGAVGANLAHFLSGADLGGGIAYVNVLCNTGFGFGVSELNGNINWALWTGAAGNFTWDFVVVAHELGHNFGSQHTHSYCPPLDQCYTNCNATSVCTRGTIMSYCHVCGGMSNVDLWFHPVTANIMRQRVNASCLDDALLSGGDFVQYRVRFNPLLTTGAKSATLEFTHDATNETQPFRVRLSGTAN